MNKNKLSNLIKKANQYDLSGYYDAADMIDDIMSKIANDENYYPGLKIGDLVFDCFCDLKENQIDCIDPEEDSVEAIHQLESIEALEENIGKDIFKMIKDHCNYSFLKSESAYEKTTQFNGEVSEESEFDKSGTFSVDLIGLNALIDQGIFKLIKEKDDSHCKLVMADIEEEYDSEYFIRE